MDDQFHEQFESLIEKYAELLTGQSSPDIIEKVKVWGIYNHMHKTMPALTNHWNHSHPEAKAQIRKLFEEIRDLNQARQAKENPSGQ